MPQSQSDRVWLGGEGGGVVGSTTTACTCSTVADVAVADATSLHPPPHAAAFVCRVEVKLPSVIAADSAPPTSAPTLVVSACKAQDDPHDSVMTALKSTLVALAGPAREVDQMI